MTLKTLAREMWVGRTREEIEYSSKRQLSETNDLGETIADVVDEAVQEEDYLAALERPTMST